MTTAGWYVRRLSRMGPREIGTRVGDAARKRRWRGVLDEHTLAGTVWHAQRRFTAVLPDGVLAAIPQDAVDRLLRAANRLMDGQAEYFGVARNDLVSPDWAFDPRTGRRAPVAAYAFDIPYRNENMVGDIKQIWEPSRHQHLTVLATAYALTRDDRYAHRVADHLKSWWAANPPMRGVHWISGIELGIRLLSWVWVRRMLDGWSDAPGLFEQNPEALHQIWHHQKFLATFRSRGSSANNHVIAEAAGQLAASCAFGWFPQSPRWRTDAMRLLDESLRRNTFDSGLNRELATEYHGLVLELGLAAAVEADAAGMPVPDSTWLTLMRMTDALAAVVDRKLRPPRQGDADDGFGLILDGPDTDRWASLLATGDALFERMRWWPASYASDVRTPLLAALAREAGAGTCATVPRPLHLPAHFADAGMTILRAPATTTPAGKVWGEVWARCDGGPHGFLSIAAHAHADALSVEVRHNGVDILADPGTYCYHGEPEWRSYFRSTLGHNTLQLDDRDQSVSGGPFMWTRHANTRILAARPANPEEVATGVGHWCAEHDGYTGLPGAPVHRRTVELDNARRELVVFDEITGRYRHNTRLAFHLGPKVHVDLLGKTANLAWTDGDAVHSAVLELPPDLTWLAHTGETETPLGWYSDGFGRKVPSTTLVGTGTVGRRDVLITVLRFDT
ncbi:MAG TPA: alginate lyase family protein [Actinophytocola sp.]|uniref:heparinase II/III family protein n=1 Tax=Actinophytocola sp. TaxID=1872138 RepID=UPI002DB5B9DC|nr:alginate lyase family protein [Actinophytocola sp.]HEU5469748.1 alginate lyase family protein [Actinophytocola sp.]